MLFNSAPFIFIFLPVALCGFYSTAALIGRRAAMIWLLLATLVFYAWWNPAYLPLILGSILGNYLFARRLAQIPNTRGAKMLLTMGVVSNLALLGYHKYAKFLLKTVDSLTGLNYTIAHFFLP